MIITVTGRHLEVTEAIRRHANEKAQKILKYYDLIKEIEVILDGSKAKQKYVEIIVNAEHRNMFVGSEAGDDLYACIDLATHKLERQITEHKKRFRNRKHPARSRNSAKPSGRA
ncbi:MAG TPA: ribosome-associated translation inhibitor RaiA [Phycisphaerae bacterium]|nr:ribosome-associated translation inhibitor RaiA [Phycisphaerae bacterium]